MSKFYLDHKIDIPYGDKKIKEIKERRVMSGIFIYGEYGDQGVVFFYCIVYFLFIYSLHNSC